MSTIVQGLKSPNYRSNCVVNPYIKYQSIINRVTNTYILSLFIYNLSLLLARKFSISSLPIREEN